MGDNTKLYSWNLFPIPRALIGYYEEVIKIFKRVTLQNLWRSPFPAFDSLRWGIWNILYIKSCGMKSNDSFDFIPAVLIWFISCISFTFISFTGTYKHITDQLPTSVASWLSWLEYRTGIAGLQVQIPLKLLNFFFRLLTQLHKLRSQLRGSFFNWFHFHSSYMIYFMYIFHSIKCINERTYKNRQRNYFSQNFI